MALFKFKERLFNSLKLSLQIKVSPKKLFQNFGFPFLLIFIGLILVTTNYTPNTYLSGWDTLHPEFDYKLNLIRTISGVFRTEQGLGAVASHAHMVEIVRIIMLWLYDIFLPIESVRYAFFFICLIAGPLGMFYFLKKVFFKKQLPSFVGALFYLLNLGTYQVFVVPFEMFAVLYAMLPWFFLSFDSLLRKADRKNIIFFTLAVLLTSPSAYASTLWFLFFTTVLLYFVPFVILKSGVKGIVKRFFIALAIVFAVNSYWILPNIYFAINDARFVTEANINKLFSEEAFLKNKEFGNITDILTLKSFYFDWSIFNFAGNKFEQITNAYSSHLNNPVAYGLGIMYTSISAFGSIVALKRYKALSFSFLLVVFFSLIFLFNNNPPFSGIFNFLQDNLPLFKEALRFPHNKIHNVFIFFVSIFFAIGIDFFIVHLRKAVKKNIVSYIFVLAIGISLIYYMKPAFQGNLINKHMKSSIPNEYFEMFEYLSHEKDGRIASLPVHSPWGWVYNRWDNSNFQGAGFLYFGIKQSLLDRDFDRWNPMNEQFYLEISNAIYAEDVNGLRKVIDKYDISYLMLDESIINPGSDSKALYFDVAQKMFEDLNKSDDLKMTVKEFGDYLTVYKFGQEGSFPLSSLADITLSGSYENNYYKDYIFNQYGNYADFKNDNESIPFSFINNESKVDKNLVKITDNYAVINLQDNSASITQSTDFPDAINSQIVGTRRDDGLLSLDIYPSVAKIDDTELVSPIHNEVLIADSTLIAVNENVIYLDKVGTNTPTVLDSPIITSSSNVIATFDRNADPLINYYLPSVPMTYSYCNNEDDSAITASVSDDSLILLGKLKHDYCLSIPAYIFVNDVSQTTLGKITFKNDNSSKISSCLINDKVNKCYYNLPVKNRDNLKTIEFAASPASRDTTQIQIRIGASDAERIDLSSMEINLYPSVSETSIGSSYFKQSIPDRFSELSFPLISNDVTKYVAESTSGLSNECKTENSISSKKIVDTNLPYFEYSSKSGSFCDHIPFGSLSHAMSYIVAVKSQNTEGLPLSICITNYSSRKCDVFAKLSKFVNSDTDLFFLPATDKDGSGYDINIENRSVKNSPSSNRLYSVQFIPVIDNLLGNVQSGILKGKNYKGKILSTEKITPSILLARVENKPTLIKLSMAYHEGFKAYKIQCKNNWNCFFKTILAPLNGKELEHGKGSSWSNVWEYIPSNNNNERIAIIFYPQYLQYLGFGILGLLLLYLVIPNWSYVALPFLVLDNFFNNKADFFKNKVIKRTKNLDKINVIFGKIRPNK